jgi:hypothetical protein
MNYVMTNGSPKSVKLLLSIVSTPLLRVPGCLSTMGRLTTRIHQTHLPKLVPLMTAVHSSRSHWLARIFLKRGIGTRSLETWRTHVLPRIGLHPNLEASMSTMGLRHTLRISVSSLPSPVNGLRGKSNPNQITQGTDSIPVVWTSFSPFRAFLWAAFGADVINNVPTPRVLSKLNSEWIFRNETYKGVLLLQFSPNQPSPVGCSAYTIPANQEGPWAAIASAGGTLLAEEPARNLWEKFASIHGQVRGSEWPDVVHGLELPSSHGIQCWRSIWFGKGIQALNSQHQQSLAIQYIHEQPDLPPPHLPPARSAGTIGGDLR